YERKTKLCKIRSGFDLVFKVASKNFFRRLPGYFFKQLFQRFKEKFIKFKALKVLRIKYAVSTLINFFRKIVNLILKQNLLITRTGNKKSTKLVTFYFF